jgi:hypothetical protein
MAKRDFDFKQFMLQKGDKVGMGVAGGLAVLLLFCGVFMLFGKDASLSPGNNADALNKISADRDQRISSNPISPDERTKLRTVDPDLKNGNLNELVLLDPYRLPFPLMPSNGADDNSRRNPFIFTPVEFRLAIVNPQVGFYIFDKDREMVMIFANATKPDKKSGTGNAGGMLSSMKGAGSMGGATGPGGLRGGAGGPGGRGGPGMGAMGGGYGMGGSFGPGMPGPGGAKIDDKKIRFQKIDELKGGEPLAEDLYPFRAAMVVGSFPLKKQLEEYQRAVHARTISELYDSAHPEFGFLGFKVQRREVDAIGDNQQAPWIDIPLEEAFKWWALQNGRRFEPEDPELMPLITWSDGLVMERPELIKDRSQPYPSLETELPAIKKSLEQIKNLGKKATPPKNPFKDSTGLNAFRHGGTSGSGGQEMGEGTLGKPNVPTGPIKPGTGSGGGIDGPDKAGAMGALVEPPDFALIRFLDIYLEPGKTYEYQVKVLLNNPNKDRTDVPSYLSDPKELESEWMPVGHRLFVPEEIQYYAFDARLDPKEGRKFAGLPANNQAVLQVHRWVPTVNVSPKGDKKTDLPVADWLVAERVMVYKGENIGQSHKLKVPVWKFSQADFELATNPAVPARDKHYIDVSFSGSFNDAVLVDFSGPIATYKKAPKAKDDASDPVSVEVKDDAAHEVLIVTPEGKLIVRDYKADETDKVRVERVKAWKERLKKIEEADKPSKPGDDLFNKGGPGQ